ncbi:hypothetical protein HKBW3S09_01523 [Candidatus Hakubella thermalkaliphila]|uniref:Uncharacterized protein n=1 Tax=Candidatus Hakubella thermalkaliphila TaxID=2754717 RepID=A0A6V8NV89_9ACTN|nr:hypothetical protein HKBW3S09_01523 [Candidatus Hakubella thermalkaliphila]
MHFLSLVTASPLGSSLSISPHLLYCFLLANLALDFSYLRKLFSPLGSLGLERYLYLLFLMVQRRHFPEPLYDRGQNLQNIIHILFLVILTQGKKKGALGIGCRNVNSSKDV